MALQCKYRSLSHALARLTYGTLNRGIRRRRHTGIQGKVALVTGSSDTDGIGLGIVRSLAKRGCSIVLHGSRDANKVEDIREDIQSQYEVPVHYFRANFDKMDEVEGLYNKIKDLYSDGIDILVNNVGMIHDAPTEHVGIEIWEKTMRVNLTSSFYLTSLSLGDMKAKGWGRILNISSIWSDRGYPNVSGMVTSKHGMNGLTKTVALETSGSGVTCNAISPGLALTAADDYYSRMAAEEAGIPLDEYKDIMVKQINPSGKPMDIDKIGEVAAFLCSSSAGEITGALIPVDWGAAAR